MKKLSKLFCFIFIFFIFINQLYAIETCDYTSEIEACNQAYKDGMTRNIEDFVCINDKDPEKRAYQIVLDKSFKKIDIELNAYLSFLEDNKDYYFGKDKKESFLEGQETIESKFNYGGEFRLEYKKLCDVEIINQTIGCFGGKTTTDRSKDFLGNGGDCLGMAQEKLDTYKKVAYDMLKLNKDQTRKDDRKKYVQKERTMFESLVDLFNVNRGYIERVLMKWPTKTKNPY